MASSQLDGRGVNREAEMTETTRSANGRAEARRPRGGKNAGLAIERVFTTPGVHPYDEVTWERRDVVQTNWKSG